jgi:hypothetical protein
MFVDLATVRINRSFVYDLSGFLAERGDVYAGHMADELGHLFERFLEFRISARVFDRT